MELVQVPSGADHAAGQVGADVAALQAAIDAKAPADEIKTKLAKVRTNLAAKKADLDTARANLKKLLSSRQEAIGVLGGLLD